MSVDSAYRRLAIAILELDVATVAARLASQSQCLDDHVARASDAQSTRTSPIGAIIHAHSPSTPSPRLAMRAAARKLVRTAGESA